MTTNTDATLAALTPHRYALLRSYRSDGSAVDTPIWFRVDGDTLHGDTFHRDTFHRDTLVFRTKVGPKTRRLTANPHVELRPCDHRGRVLPGGATVTGRATILHGAAAETADRALHDRYGWQYNILPLLPIPGVVNVHRTLPLHEKIRRATARSLWPDSAIVAVVAIPAPGAAQPGTASSPSPCT
ncbi:PPOX class F420-dependent oxidoreductase [Mycolicibacterium palauense]|uniref:PPOX class F420-dependent oxidoreductase n=1 Tax=Mycolicibacterium palauense TaxID=2034511 RepID=UPI000BFF0D51|nr:PPOX class F420-dependent oxidoreductase [Mycolicibacterium palauense]